MQFVVCYIKDGVLSVVNYDNEWQYTYDAQHYDGNRVLSDVEVLNAVDEVEADISMLGDEHTVITGTTLEDVVVTRKAPVIQDESLKDDMPIAEVEKLIEEYPTIGWQIAKLLHI